MRARAAIAPVVLAVVLAGCGAQHGGAAQQAAPQGTHKMADGTVMNDAAMAGMHSTAATHPSSAAAMICGPETHESLQHNVGLAATPRSSSTWAGGIYTCTFHLPGGDVVVSVQDATDLTAGRHYFDSVRGRLAGLHEIKGVQSFGLPGYQDGHGVVLFLKDGKTLEVDATGLPAAVGPYHQSPGDVAYGLAAAIVACWSEH